MQRSGWSDPSLKIGLVYLAFGVAHEIVLLLYCSYRIGAGQPSDLPCFNVAHVFFVLLWPILAIGLVVHGSAVLVPSIVVRAIGLAFLGGFVFTVALVLRTSNHEKGSNDG